MILFKNDEVERKMRWTEEDYQSEIILFIIFFFYYVRAELCGEPKTQGMNRCIENESKVRNKCSDHFQLPYFREAYQLAICAVIAMTFLCRMWLVLGLDLFGYWLRINYGRKSPPSPSTMPIATNTIQMMNLYKFANI